MAQRPVDLLKGAPLQPPGLRGVAQGAVRTLPAGPAQWHDRARGTRHGPGIQHHLQKVSQLLRQQTRRGISLQFSLRPIIDGKIKPDQLRLLLDVELEKMEEEHHAPVNVLTKAADAMPGFGIVAAVLGIVITMASISGPIEQIGDKVAAALVGTFLGILLSYGFMNPLAQNLDFIGQAEIAYSRTHRGLRGRLCRRHGAHHGRGTGAPRPQQ